MGARISQGFLADIHDVTDHMQFCVFFVEFCHHSQLLEPCQLSCMSHACHMSSVMWCAHVSHLKSRYSNHLKSSCNRTENGRWKAGVFLRGTMMIHSSEVKSSDNTQKKALGYHKAYTRGSSLIHKPLQHSRWHHDNDFMRISCYCHTEQHYHRAECNKPIAEGGQDCHLLASKLAVLVILKSNSLN